MSASRFTLPISLSLVLHTGIVGLLLFSVDFNTPPKKVTQVQMSSNKPVVKAVMVESADVSKQVQRLKDQKRRQKEQELARQQKLKDEQKRIRDLERQRKKREKERVKAEAAAKKAKQEAKKAADAAKKAKSEQKKQAAIAKKAADERKRQEAAAAKAKAKRIADEKAAAAAKAKRLAAEKAAKERAEKARQAKLRKEREARERAERERQMAEQMAAEQAQLRQARQKVVLSEIDKYTALITASIQRYWITDDSMRGKQCVLNIKLAPSGLVYDVKPLSGDKIVCKSAHDAVLKAGTLPVSKDPEVYAGLKEINLTVQPEFN